MALLLGFVLLGWQWASQGKNWEGLGRSESGAGPLPSLSQLEFEVQPDDSGLTLAPDEAPTASLDSRQEPADLSDQLPSEWLATMQDGRLGLSPSEQTGLDQSLQRVRSQTAAELSHAAARDVGFVRLNEHPEQYRGRLLEFPGTLWDLSLFREGDPTRTGDEVYEAWLYTPDAANHPTRVLFTDLPATLQPGQRLNQPVQCAGYFIQRYGYATSNGTHIAPLFVAKTLLPQSGSTVAAQVRSGKTGQRWLGEWLVVVATSAMLIWFLTRTRKPNEM